MKNGGGTLELKADCVTKPPQSSILWRLKNNKVADFDKDFGTDITYYGDLKGRTTLNTTTGELRITGLKKSDEGVYSVDIDSKPCEKTYTLSVIKAVPKPVISVSYEDQTYILTCNGDTADAEPVTYWWKVGEGNWEKVEKTLKVTKSKPTQNNTKYTCKLKNIVSEKESEAVGNLFEQESSSATLGVTIFFFIIIIAAIVAFVIGYFVWKKKAANQKKSLKDFCLFLRDKCCPCAETTANNQTFRAQESDYVNVGDNGDDSHNPPTNTGTTAGAKNDNKSAEDQELKSPTNPDDSK
ncbi:hypothetical protein DPEC_G00152630 [Dallia pectoralis]|uniref:Uncharacterized protein n=1 Tax=Dallia pectoralis TaxID=75939 RepID=A0ACC2GK49_DALPE|nr:hypothetical protein DPEC_G00152630 [Dallia pectoralis]